MGPLSVDADSGPVELGPPKQRMVLAILLLRANEVVSSEQIVDLVWGDRPPKTAEHSVQIYISELRKAFSEAGEDGLIETKSPGYVIYLPESSIDVLHFEQLARRAMQAARAPGEDGLVMLEEALGLWTGSPLLEFEYEDFAQGHIQSLREIRADVQETLASLHLDRGNLGEAREYCRRLIADHPLREGPRRLMMLALQRSGRQADALREYASFRELLADELGIEPSADLRDLEERILLQDAGLQREEGPGGEGSNPYCGLRAFSEDDADVYFGREDLVDEVLARLRDGVRLVSMVGPSGSGKSSALRAGIIPSLRRSGSEVALLQPGPRPLWELSGVLSSRGFGSRSTILRSLERSPAALAKLVDRELILIVDQFEELYTLALPETSKVFTELVAAALADDRCGLSMVTALRADYFDHPLSDPALAPLFAEATLSVGPLSAQGLERAIVEPATRAGRRIESELLAQLIADMRDQPGALPLLQYTLFDLFARADGDLGMDVYKEIGGLLGALTSAADEILDELDSEERELAEQVFMRLIKKGRVSTTATPAPLREIMELGDHLDLQRVLEAFGERRLLTFGRDASNRAVVEMAHEYLIKGWPLLGDWIDTYGEDLDKLSSLKAAVDEWETNEHSEDFLFRGTRLSQVVEWWMNTPLRLATAEREFIEAAVEERDRPPPPPDVVAVFERRGDGSFCDLIGAGIDLAEAEHGVEVLEHTGQLTQIEIVEDAMRRGCRLVLLDAFELTNRPIIDLISNHPETTFILLGSSVWGVRSLPLQNLKRLESANEEMGLLAGAIAGLSTRAEKVGYIAGLDLPGMREFQAGFEQGVARVNPVCEVQSIYLTAGRMLMDTSGFNSVALGAAAAAYLGRLGADVIFHAAGGSGWGLFTWAAKHLKNTGREVKTIGVDIDQAKQLEIVKDAWGLDPSDFDAMRQLMLASVVWRLDQLISDTIEAHLRGDPIEGVEANIANGGIGYVATANLADGQRATIDRLMDEVRNGTLEVSKDPKGPTLLLLEELAK